MACRTCGKNKQINSVLQAGSTELAKESTLTGGSDFSTIIPSKLYVDTHTTNGVSIMQSMVKLNHIPLGWYVLIQINKITIRVDGLSPSEVVSKVVSLYKDNGVDIQPSTVWFNANLQWVERVGIRHQKATKDMLLSLLADSSPLKPEIIEPSIDSQGRKLWGGLQAYLTISSEGFRLSTFDNYLEMLTQVLADDKVGCEDCSKHFEVAKEQATSVKNLEDARLWLYSLIANINKSNNKPVLTKEQAYKINEWTE